MMREKLIELLEQAKIEAHEVCGSMNDGFGAWYADYLLANGVIVLPCKVGQDVWTTHWWDEVKEKCVDSKGKTFFRMNHKRKVCKEKFDPFGLEYKQFGKTVFLTREEAEAALCERGEENA